MPQYEVLIAYYQGNARLWDTVDGFASTEEEAKTRASRNWRGSEVIAHVSVFGERENDEEEVA